MDITTMSALYSVGTGNYWLVPLSPGGGLVQRYTCAGLDHRSCSTSSPVSAGMGDPLAMLPVNVAWSFLRG